MNSMFDKDKPVPQHLSWVEVDIYKGCKSVGRVFHYPKGQVVVRGHAKNEQDEYFEYEVQLNHPSIKHEWKLVQQI